MHDAISSERLFRAASPAPGGVVQRRVKNVVIAYLLWLTLGLFGAHRFYLGSVILGLTQVCLLALALVTTGGWAGHLALAAWASWFAADSVLIPRVVAALNRGDPVPVPHRPP